MRKIQEYEVIGKQYNRLTILSRIEGGRSFKVECICECGNKTIVAYQNLINGHTKSCGCYKVIAQSKRVSKKQPEYRNWLKMRERCRNVKNDNYKHYGGAGIKVCDSWNNSFDEFFKDMGPKPSAKHSIERKNGKLGYSKDNCVWATKGEQMKNITRNRWLEYGGKKMILQDWAREFGVSHASLSRAITRKTFEGAAIFYNKKKAMK